MLYLTPNLKVEWGHRWFRQKDLSLCNTLSDLKLYLQFTLINSHCATFFYQTSLMNTTFNSVGKYKQIQTNTSQKNQKLHKPFFKFKSHLKKCFSNHTNLKIFIIVIESITDISLKFNDIFCHTIFMVHNVFYKTISNSFIRNASCNAFLVMHLVMHLASCFIGTASSLLNLIAERNCFAHRVSDADFPRVSATLGLITKMQLFSCGIWVSSWSVWNRFSRTGMAILF